MLIMTTERFTLKELTQDDASLTYLGWFQDPHTQQFIANKSQSLAQLRTFIQTKKEARDALFLGIYHQHQHIGNIKYEPINFALKQATMGILIGETQWRGKGVAGEVIAATAEFLALQYGIQTILLGVEQENSQAVKAYEKLGFRVYKETDDGLYMILELSAAS